MIRPQTNPANWTQDQAYEFAFLARVERVEEKGEKYKNRTDFAGFSLVLPVELKEPALVQVRNAFIAGWKDGAK